MNRFILIIVCFSPAIFILLLYFIIFNSGITNEHQKWSEFGCLLSGVFSFASALLLYFNLAQTKRDMRKSNSLPLMINLMSELRGKDFINSKRIIYDNIGKYRNHIMRIRDLDPELRDAIVLYSHAMDNIGLMVYNKIIDQDIILVFYGTEIRRIFKLIKPFLDKERESFQQQSDDHINQEAYQFYLFHFEYLMKIADSRGNKLIKKYKKLNGKLNEK